MSPLDGYRLQIGEPFEKIPSAIADYLRLTGGERKTFIDKRMYEHLNDIGPVTKQTTRNRWIISEERRTSEGGVVGVWTDVTELIEARQAAEAANRAKSEFLAMISHEIRTPMNAVLGMASVLQESEMQAEQRLQVETIQNSGEALLALINDVLDLSKIEARRIELETEEFSLQGVLDAVLDIAGARAAVKQLEVVAFADIGLPDRLLGDANRLRQILLNLVSNAIKFTEKGSICIEAHAISQSSTGTTTVRLEVMDTGMGIPAEVLEKLFTPFTQADASTTRRYGGTGLGLTISKQLVELMGGRIGVESTSGEGSYFWIEAPFFRLSLGKPPTHSKLRTIG
jgi:signal transduction histidine kinase